MRIWTLTPTQGVRLVFSGRGDGGSYKRGTVSNGAVPVGRREVPGLLGIFCLLLLNGGNGVGKHGVDGRLIQARIPFVASRGDGRRSTQRGSPVVGVELGHGIAQTTGHGVLLPKVGGRQNTRDWMALGHLVQDLSKEALLHLGGLLYQGICGGGALSLAQDSKPLFNGAQLILEILVQSGSSHLFQHGLVLFNVLNPLLTQPVGIIEAALLGLLIIKNLGGRTNRPCGKWGVEGHVG